MSTEPKDARGGARPGAGRPPKTATAARVEQLRIKLAKVEARFGEDIDETILSLAFDTKVPAQTRVAVWAKYNDMTMARISEGGPADYPRSDAGMPQRRPDPAKVVQLERPGQE